MYPGDEDVRAAAATLAAELPDALEPLARAAYNYRWTWLPDGPECFAAVVPERWPRVDRNPVRQLREATSRQLEAAAANRELVQRAHRLADALDRHPAREQSLSEQHPVAFFSAEFGVHASLPIYSGGLGVLAGDIVKEASDLGVPLVGIGLLYRTGYFHQRIDVHGYQHEYWIENDTALLPCARVRDPSGLPVTVTVPVSDEDITVQVWRVDVGRVPLYLLDADLPENSLVGRWATSRLYEGNRAIRLAQYAVLGIGGMRVLDALGFEPAVLHLNEGHAALAAMERVRTGSEHGGSWDEAWQRVREQVVFTTHTPVPAGNETYARDEVLRVLGRYADTTGDRERFLACGRVHGDDGGEPSGMTVLALRASRRANAVSRRHGEVAREMWQPLFGATRPDDVPITHVTNGVHVATWLGPAMRALLDKYLGDDWLTEADRAERWKAVDDIPDEELWETRRQARSAAIEMLRRRATEDRLQRGEELDYVEAIVNGFDPDRLTIGFARRLATYKRLHLLSLRADRALPLLSGDRSVQFVFAGKAHPLDESAKRVLADLFRLKGAADVRQRVAFLEDYDLRFAADLVAGCDVWVNLPRPPLEASGTSGMKAALNGGLHLSVLDGWWAEAYDGTNGWAIDGAVDPDEAAQDERHADALFDVMERDVVPMFYERDGGIPRRWLAMVRASLRTNGPRFSATRMVKEYEQRIYS